MPHYTYILRCADGTLYTGFTTDVGARERAHNEGRGARYTAGRGPVRVVYVEASESRSAAQKRESQIKRWTRKQKDALIAGFSDPSLTNIPAKHEPVPSRLGARPSTGRHN